MGSMASEQNTASPPLVGTAGNPARDPKSTKTKAEVGERAFRNAVIIVLVAWAIVLFVFISLHNHSV